MASFFVLGNKRIKEKDTNTIKDIIDELASSDRTQQKVDQIVAIGRDSVYAKAIPAPAYRWHSVVPGQGLSGGQATAQAPITPGQTLGQNATYGSVQNYGTPVPGTTMQPQGLSNLAATAAGSTPAPIVPPITNISSGPPVQVPAAPQQAMQSFSEIRRLNRLLGQGHMY